MSHDRSGRGRWGVDNKDAMDHGGVVANRVLIMTLELDLQGMVGLQMPHQINTFDFDVGGDR